MATLAVTDVLISDVAEMSKLEEKKADKEKKTGGTDRSPQQNYLVNKNSKSNKSNLTSPQNHQYSNKPTIEPKNKSHGYSLFRTKLGLLFKRISSDSKPRSRKIFGRKKHHLSSVFRGGHKEEYAGNLDVHVEVLPKKSNATLTSAAKVGNLTSVLQEVSGPREGAGDGQLSSYQLVSVVGKGSFGKVFLACNRSRKPVVIKVLEKAPHLNNARHLAHIMTERNVVKLYGSHPFILSYVTSFQDMWRLFLVTEFCSGGDLFFHLQKNDLFTESMVKFYCAEIIEALIFLHDKDVAYRDLKPENIFLDRRGHIRLGDFGLAIDSIEEFSGAKTICGTPAFISPEMLKVRRPNACASEETVRSYGYSTDWWSLGNVLYDMLFGIPPFYDDEVLIMYKQILEKEVDFPDTRSGNEISDELRCLISQLLVKDPKKRLGSSTEGGELAIKSHPFFTGINWDGVIQSKLTPPIVPTFQQKNSQRRSWGDVLGSSSSFRSYFGKQSSRKYSTKQFSVKYFDSKFTRLSPEKLIRPKCAPSDKFREIEDWDCQNGAL